MTRRDVLIHGGLYLACLVTTTWTGGIAYSATLMSILTCHELGHYLMARRRGVQASLPYFIPLPPPTPGTLGAVMGMNDPIEDRNALFDVGAAGPIAGLVVAIPLLVIGLMLSDVIPQRPDGNIEGNSLLYAGLKYAVFGRWLPGDGVDVELHPMAIGAWVGLFVTAINLMPIGQLDGGHIARALLGQSHEKWSARLHAVLPCVGIGVGAVMLVAARNAGHDWSSSLKYARDGLIPWLVWAIFIAFMRRQAGEYHAPVNDIPLDPRRRLLALAMLVLFVLIATPVPSRSVL